MLAQLILTIKGEQKGDMEPLRFVGCFDNEKIAFVEYHYILPVFNLNDFNWTQTPSAVDDKTVETVRGVVPQDKLVVFRFGADDAEIKSFVARNFTSGESPVLTTPIDRNNFTFIYQKWRNEVMPHIDAPWDVLKKKYALYDRDFFLAEMNVDDHGTADVSDDRPAEDFYITFDAKARDPYAIRRKNEDELNFNLTFGFKGGSPSSATADGAKPVPPCVDSTDSATLRLCVRENLSPAARAVLDAGRELWRYYHAKPDANPNASYYDIRAHFQGCKPNGAMNAKSSDATYNALISALRAAHKNLAAQVGPKVYEYGFLKR